MSTDNRSCAESKKLGEIAHNGTLGLLQTDLALYYYAIVAPAYPGG